ncbi:MAG: amidohydrolase family protein [Gammaproteobacteria bacterium]|nr:amidohydrolase family protein [Gammaproteobacteria bacterium]
MCTRDKLSRAPILSAVAAVGLFLPACADAPEGGSSDAVVFEGARVIVGDGGVIEDGVFVVEDGRFAAVGAAGEVEAPAGATHMDLAGKTVMPAIVNAHIHLASDRETRTDQLQHYAYYGQSMVVSLGLDEGDVGFQMRGEMVPDGARSQSAGRGITSPEPGRSEVPHWVTTDEEARAAVRGLAADQVDFVKIWVDDRSGQYERLSAELYGAVIDEAHANGLRVTAHVFTLEDAKGLLRAGVDAFAHGIRDMDVDDELIALWQERPNVVLVPNLPAPGVAEDMGWLAGSVPASRVELMQTNSFDRPELQEFFGIQARNLNRLSQEGITISFGTDGSSPWAAHQELADMVRTGMSPADVIVAATSASAEFVGADDLGTVAAGRSADFIVLDANPLDDITNTRMIDAVYLRGAAMDRDGLGARFRGAGQ